MGEAAGVDHLQQSGEGLGVAVVGRGGQEQAVLALVRQAPQGAGALRVHGVALPAPGGRGHRRGHVVGFIDDEHVEGVAAGRSRPLGVGQDLAQEALFSIRAFDSSSISWVIDTIIPLPSANISAFLLYDAILCRRFDKIGCVCTDFISNKAKDL